ncbi:MAG: T9SS type A sorting domain-containing protein, partial [Bacteroidota bacterium]
IQGDNNGYVPTVEETTLGAYDAPFVSDYLAVGALKFVGNLAVTEVEVQNYPSHSSPLYYWQAYHTFGDPSTYIYLTQGTENEVSHMSIVPIGLDTYTVNALAGSYVAISKDGVLHGAAFVDETGEVEVPIEPILDGGNVSIVVTKAQHIPYIMEVPAAALVGPFVVLDHYEINGDPAYNQTVTLDVMIKNVGADPVGEVTASLSGSDPFITIVNAGEEVTFDGMNAGEEDNTSLVENAYTLEISMNVPDNYQATFPLTITDGEEEWISNLKITAYAPVFEIDPLYVIDDSQSGNNNGRLDPGENANIIFSVTNNGNTTAQNPVLDILGDSPYLTLAEEQLALEPIAAGETLDVPVEVETHSSASEGTFTQLNLEVEDGHWFSITSELVIGQVPEMQLGDGNSPSNQYPFYNYYKANRSQMLYLNSELGSGEKTIKEIGFDITQVADNYRDLPNFKILLKHVSISQMPGSFVDMADASEVFSAEVYNMPQEIGWHVWDIEDFVYDGESNLLIEVVWGQLPGWTSDYYKVASTNMPVNMVSYGYSDQQVVPAYNGNSTTRPNLFMAFQAEETDPMQEVTFMAKTNDMSPLQDAAIKIGSHTMLTSESGEAVINLYPGTYTYHAMAEGFDPIPDQNFTIDDQSLEIEVIFGPVMHMVEFIIDNTYGHNVDQASITLNGIQHNAGEYMIEDLEPGTYEYIVSCHGHYDKTGSFEITDHNLEVYVTLSPDGTYADDLRSAHQLKVFPNPTRGMIQVQTNGISSDLVVTITDYQGAVLQTQTISSQRQFNINLHGYSAGIYYLRIESEQGVMIRKIVLQ